MSYLSWAGARQAHLFASLPSPAVEATDCVSKVACRLIADDEASYKYLVESIRRFPDHVTFKGMMQQVGFSSVKHIPMSGRIVALYSGIKL